MGNMTTVLVPKDLRDTIKVLADRENKPMWRVIEEAISLMYAEKRKPAVKSSLSNVEKVSWYICKVLMSVGELKAIPSEDNLSKLERTVIQVADRLGLPHSNINLLLSRCRAYVKADESTRKQLRREINAVTKMVAVDIMTSSPSDEELED